MTRSTAPMFMSEVRTVRVPMLCTCDVTEKTCPDTSAWFGDLKVRMSAPVLSSPSKNAEVSVEAGSCKQRREVRILSPENSRSLRFSPTDEICSSTICCFRPQILVETFITLHSQAPPPAGSNYKKKIIIIWQEKGRRNLKWIVKKGIWHFVST